MKIKRSLLKMILAVAKDSYPYEIIALLAGKKNVAEELIILPFESGMTSAIIHTEMLPLGMKILGSVHSHPTPNNTPSSADIEMFSRFGRYHIIVGYPYTERSWRCYDRFGKEVNVEIVD